MNAPERIAVVGGGAYGTALAQAAALAGRAVVLWMRDEAAAERAASTRTNERYLPGLRLHPNLRVTARAAELGDAEAILLAVPAQALRGALGEIADVLPPAAPVVSCAKGIERTTGLFMSEVIGELLPEHPIAALSGPSFAADLARGLPTALALAAPDEALAAGLAAALSGPVLRIYSGTDVRGVEIGGAAKNVLAIAVGIVEGRGLGESAEAALTARGFAELLRFAAASGARSETLMGLSGLGDVVLSCGSRKSRNFSLGLRIGEGAAPSDAAGGALAEGAYTAEALVVRARAAGVEMPVAEAVAAVLAGRLGVGEAVEALMRRPLRAE